MKIILILISTVVLSALVVIDFPKKIPPGRYNLELDAKYRNPEDKQLFTLEYERFIMVFPDKVENLKVEWIDEDSFIVKDYTESTYPSAIEFEQLKRYRPSFNIVKEVNNEFHFVLGSQEKRDTIFFGKFIKFKD